MEVALWIWVATIAGTVALLAFDFFAHVRTPHEPSMREAAWWTLFYVALAVVFGLGMTGAWGSDRGLEFFAGYITEKSLSVDNLFVFVIIMAKFSVPREYQQKVLLIGVVIALILRTVFIMLGAAAIEHFSWVFYLFGLFLIGTAIKLMTGKQSEDTEYHPNIAVRAVRRMLPTTEHYHGARLTVKIDGRRYVTPMMVVMVAIGMTDVLFALDSIPAIYGLTNVPYIVFTTNAFALLGLIQLYFLLGGLLDRLVYLSIGLSLILGFIGVKLIIEALLNNSLGFINNGEPLKDLPHIPIWLSLMIIVGILAVTTVASLIKSRSER